MKFSPAEIWNFYADGFRSMTVGRRLWLIIIIKLVILFGVLKIFFFPDFIGSKTSDKPSFVRQELLDPQRTR